MALNSRLKGLLGPVSRVIDKKKKKAGGGALLRCAVEVAERNPTP